MADKKPTLDAWTITENDDGTANATRYGDGSVTVREISRPSVDAVKDAALAIERRIIEKTPPGAH